MAPTSIELGAVALPGWVLQVHERATVIVDEAAAVELKNAD